VRSWGLVRKRGNAGMELFEVLGACLIGGTPRVLTAKNSTTSGRHDMEITTVCQENPYKNITQRA
jgi:hypothetical protein